MTSGTRSTQAVLRTICLTARLAAAASCCLALAGCADLSYYWQAADGQLDLWHRSRPIEDWLTDPSTGDPLKVRLLRVSEMRTFASQELGLPDNGSYRSFADVQRAFLVWNVFAAPELSLTAKEWCFPVAGCVAYRGYFAEAPARTLARKLADEGYDTYVGGVAAYSTLGWFDDPVPSTVIAYPDADLARLIFHELAHQVVYVPGDTTFNESFATAVEREGARRWALAHGSAADLDALDRALAREGQFTALVLATRTRLANVYAGPGDEPSKRAAKHCIIDGLRAEYARLEADWGPQSRYSKWFAGPLNNAQIASVAAYAERLPAFNAILAQNQGDLKCFFREVRSLARLPRSERERRLDALAGTAPKGPSRIGLAAEEPAWAGEATASPREFAVYPAWTCH
jgi:predicted aminopeptidase